jgi:roadblock/LC7 domain-containing protein
MLSPRLTNCPQCENIPSLIADIDCKMAEMSNSLYNNIIYMLNQSFDGYTMYSLLNYKRILSYKICNPNYAGAYSVNMIASKIKLLKYK